MVEQFQTTDEVQVFMLNKQAGGVALTLDAADYVVLVDEDTIPDVDEQVEDRAHRTSRIHNVTVYRLRCMGTQDEEVAWIAAARLDVQQYLLDGARGVKAARALYEKNRSK
jgi:SNF2 family DNA or RNA helicase